MPTLAEYAEGIRGVVWDAGGDAPSVGTSVRLEAAGQFLAETITDQNGVFAFEPGGNMTLPPGPYRLLIDVRGRLVERWVTVNPAEPVTTAGHIEV